MMDIKLTAIDWSATDEAQRRQLLARPRQARRGNLAEEVSRIIAQVRNEGDAALYTLTRLYDRVELGSLWLDDNEIERAPATVDAGVRAAIDEAYERIRSFHRAGLPRSYSLETAPGVLCQSLWRPIRRVGLYVPAGSAPLPSTALMLGVPAQLAGCSDVVLCSPPDADGGVDPTVIYAASRCGIRCILRVGGAQAIAALAYGTHSVERCDKLFGPGNSWVTEAKLQVAADPDGAAIDMPAGPSEVLVIADGAANAEFVAADLLAQAEHGPDSQTLLVTDSFALAAAVERAVVAQLARLPRAQIAAQALAHSRLVVAESIAEAFAISNRYAPEHLIVQVREPRQWLAAVQSAGSVFLGPHTPESLGDYCSGTNHVLPTYGFARAYSGVSVTSFMKSMTVQEASPDGLARIGPCAMTLARSEGLVAHERAVSVRLDALAGKAP